VLKVLRDYKLYAKLSEYFIKRKIHYLWHIILVDGIPIDPEKIEAITGCPTPRNVMEVRSFMALVGY
jgi:hypothetical protein